MTLNSKILVSWFIFESTELMVGVKWTKHDCTNLHEISHRTGTAFNSHGLGTGLHLNFKILVCWVIFESTELVVGV